MNPGRLLIIALFDLRQSLIRLKGLFFILPFFVFTGSLLLLLYENGGEGKLTSLESFTFFTWLLDNHATAQNLLILNPASLSIVFIILLGFTPLFAIFCSNDQLASDTGRKTFRYLLTRCNRLELFLGRFLSSFLLYTLALFIVMLNACWISLAIDSFSIVEILTYTAQIFLLMLLYALPFIAYVAIISAFMSSGLGALLMSFCVYLFLLYLDSYLASFTGMDVSLLPSGIKHLLYGMKVNDIYWALIGLSTYTLIYMCAAWLIFNRRNI
jgi:hypothetical protein